MFTYAHRHFWSTGSPNWPFTVWGLPKPNLKPHEYWPSKTRCCNSTYRLRYWNKRIQKMLWWRNLVATVPTIYGIETVRILIQSSRSWSQLQQYLPFTVCAEGCETAEEQSDDEVRTSQVPERSEGKTKVIKQQSLPFTVCAAECETAEEQSDDEVRTSQVPEWSEGKTKVIRQQCLPFTVLKLCKWLYILLCMSGCNSAYRSRYWNPSSKWTPNTSSSSLQQSLPFTVLKLGVVSTLQSLL